MNTVRRDREEGSPASLQLERRTIRRQFSRAAAEYDDASVLQRRVADELVERVELLRSPPTTVLDLGAGTGYAGHRLIEKFPRAQVIGLDLVPAMAIKASAIHPNSLFVVGDASDIPFATGAIDLVVSNLMLHWCDIGRVFLEAARILETGGAFVFSTLGPDSLLELRTAWSKADDYPHVHSFSDMHDLGDALVQAGFSKPVLDTDRITVTHQGLIELVHELRRAGATNALGGRRKTWTGKDRYRRFVDGCEVLCDNGRLPSTWEIVYGFAFAGDVAVPGGGEELRIPVITVSPRN